jgi:hypothetical protein
MDEDMLRREKQCAGEREITIRAKRSKGDEGFKGSEDCNLNGYSKRPN